MGLLQRGSLKTLRTAWLGRLAYREALELQGLTARDRVAGLADDTLFLLEHPHVYTIGRRGDRGDVLWDDETLRERGVEVVEADRGGRVTYHGPGQLVGYPIVDLGPGADLVGYLRHLEEAVIRTLARWEIGGERDEGNTGVWVSDAKIAAIGVRVARGVTKHGFALNVDTDLSYFAGIVPCGILDRGVTSMGAELVAPPSVEEVATAFSHEFAAVFGYQEAA